MAAKSLHERREITFAELGALLGVRAMLAAGVLAKTDRCTIGNDSGHFFNMSTPGAQNEHCGSVGCIGGTMAFIMGHNPVAYVGCSFKTGSHSPTLRSLFYPPEGGYSGYGRTAWDNWDWITPKIAVQAIDNWRRTGKPAWTSLYKRRQQIEAA